jgi:homospermidine synthase
MNRLEERTVVLEEDIHGKIFSVCLALKMSKCGTSEPLLKTKEKRYLDFIETVISTWENSFEKDAEFDNAVLKLCKATLKMYAI